MLKRCRVSKKMVGCKSEKVLHARIKRGWRVVLPSGLVDWKIGQRVFFFALPGVVHVSAVPRGLVAGRFIGSHIQRGVIHRPHKLVSVADLLRQVDLEWLRRLANAAVIG